MDPNAKFAQEVIRRGWVTFGQIQDVQMGRASDALLSDLLVEAGHITRAQADEVLKPEPDVGTKIQEALKEAEPEERLNTLGPFTFSKKIGFGSMGAVYRGRKEKDDRELAVKLFHPGFSKAGPYLDELKRNAKKWIRLTHPAIVKSVEFGITQGRVFHSTLFQEGVTLSKHIRNKGEADPLRIGEQIASALDAIHQEGLFHGDVKPGNILVATDGTVRLTDCGEVQRILSDSKVAEAAGLDPGSREYRAPEKKIDIRSDLYGLGVTLLHVVGGAAPSKLGDDIWDQMKPELRDLIKKLTAMDPDKRIATPAEALKAIRDLRPKPRPARRKAQPKPDEPGPKKAKRQLSQRERKLVTLIGVGAGAVIMILILVIFLLLKPESQLPVVRKDPPPLPVVPEPAPAPAPEAAPTPEPAPAPTPPPRQLEPELEPPPPPKEAPKLTLSEHFKRLKPSVVVISINGQHSGTGFVVSDNGEIMTNYHVIETARSIQVEIGVQESSGAHIEEYDDVEVLAIDPRTDVAILRPVGLRGMVRPLEVSHSAAPATGEEVFVIGNPGAGADVLSHTLTKGIISADHREMAGVSYIQFTAPVNPGNSGGPLFSMDGKTIGLVTMKLILQEGIAFAVPMYTAWKVFAGRHARFKVRERFQDWNLIRRTIQDRIDEEDYEGAIKASERFVSYARKAFGPEHANVAEALSWLGEVQLIAKETLDAKVSLDRALELYRKSMGETHDEVARLLTLLAGVHAARNEYESCRDAVQQAVDVYEKILGPNHPVAIATLLETAVLFRQVGLDKQAAELEARARKMERGD